MASDAPAPGAEPPAPTAGADDLARRRNVLARRFAELQWDLGGMAYEMASRDHFRLDVLTRHAAELQAVDAELAGVERMLRLEDAGAAGTCPNCNAHVRAGCRLLLVRAARR